MYPILIRLEKKKAPLGPKRKYFNLTTDGETYLKDFKEESVDIFEETSRNNRNVNEVIGFNLEQFVQEFIEVSGGVETIPYLLSYSTFLYAIYLLFIKLYMVVKASGPIEEIIKSETLDMGILIMYAVISYIFFPMMYILVRRSAKKGYKKST